MIALILLAGYQICRNAHQDALSSGSIAATAVS